MSVTGWAAFNGEQLISHADPVSWAGYLQHADFWSRTRQNWQSEMLAVGSMAIFAVYLRQRGSPESKPVGAADGGTGQTGWPAAQLLPRSSRPVWAGRVSPRGDRGARPAALMLISRQLPSDNGLSGQQPFPGHRLSRAPLELCDER